MQTTAVTLSEARRAWDASADDVGCYLAITTWTDEHGEVTDMHTGTGATPEAALEAAQAMRRDGHIAGGKDAVYLVVPDPSERDA